MASFVPAKSQPLHNFELPPLLKWKKDGKSNGEPKRRRSMKSPSQRRDAASASPPRCSPLRDYATPTSPRTQSPVCEGMKQLEIGGESERLSFLREEAVRYSRGREWSSEASRKGKGGVIEYHRNHFKKSAFCSLTQGVCSSNSEKGNSNLLIKIDTKQEEDNRKERPVKIESDDEDGGIDDLEKVGKSSNKLDEEEDIKLWNLRPRNVKNKLDKAKVGGEKGEVCGKRNKDKAVGKEGKSGEKKKLSICVALTKEEIEEDIFALTGSKASRRPKRRPKNIQKQLDVAFPGLWLVSITPESYKVSENSLKG